jgi:GTPase SAR1 family protein
MQRNPQSSKKYEKTIIVVGDKGTGKSSIIQKYSKNFFSNSLPGTLGKYYLLKVAIFFRLK